MAGSALCSAETLLGPEARTVLLYEGFAARGSVSQKRRSPLAGAYRGRCNPPKYFRVSRRGGSGQASFPLDCCLRKSHRKPGLCTRSGFALQLRCAGGCFPKEACASRPMACAAVFCKTGLALQVSAWTFSPSDFSRCLQARGHAHRSTLSDGFGTSVPGGGHWANPLATAGMDSEPLLSIRRLRPVAQLIKEQQVLSVVEVPDLPYLRYSGG